MWIGRIIVVIFCIKCICGDDGEFRDGRMNTWGDLKKISRLQRSLESSKKPKLPICCPSGTFMTSPKYLNCSSVTSNPIHDLEIPPIFTNDLEPSKKGPEDFEKIYGIPCKNSIYELSHDAPRYDKFYLLENGQLFLDNSNEVPDVYMDIDNYCLSNWMDDNGTNTRIITCYLPEEKREIPWMITICLIMSIISLAVTFFVYAFLPELRNIHGMTVMAYVATFFWGYVGLAVIQFGATSPWHHRGFCIASAFVIYYSFQSSFVWLNVMCLEIWRAFGGFHAPQDSVKHSECKKFITYSIYAWGCPLIITIVSLIMDFVPGIPDDYIKPRFGETSCCMRDEIAKIIYFYAPVAVTLICNVILFISTAMKIRQQKKDIAMQLKGSDSRRHDDNKQWFNLYLKLFIVMGLHQGMNWVINIISYNLKKDTPQYIWTITTLAIYLEGVVISIIFVWKDRTKRLLIKRLGW